MSRLIDAEPLIEFFEKKRTEWFDLDIGASSAYDIARQAVEEAETVEAIPIVWLKRFKAGECQDSYWSWFTDRLIKMWREEQSNGYTE